MHDDLLARATFDIGGRVLLVRQLDVAAGATEALECAGIMSMSEPWLSLGRDANASLAAIAAPDRETYVALDDARVADFIVVIMRGAFVGYIQSIAVREDWRSRGLGARLVAFAEERIFRESPNVFICVSSFNPRARALYERLGYRLVGELTDYLVPGHSELLLRKTLGPLSAYRAIHDA